MEVIATTKDTLSEQSNSARQSFISYHFYYFMELLNYTVQGSHSLLTSDGRFQTNPWVLSFGVLVGSVGFTILVLAFFLIQNQRLCSRSKSSPFLR